MTRQFPGTVAAAPITRQLAAAAALLAGLLALLVAVTEVGLVRAALGALLAIVLATVLARAAHRAEVTSLGPAGAVTLARGVLVVGVATLVGSGTSTGTGRGVAEAATAVVPGQVALVVLTGVALVLDAVDGPVARRTGTVTSLGARFDMETDAVLLLVLSVHVATFADPWMLALGLPRYAFAAAARVLPWLHGELPVRRTAKVVAALQGVVLVVAAAHVLPAGVLRWAVAVALAAVVWSFGVSVVWLWRAADEHPVRWRVAGGALLTACSAVLVVGILVLPNDLVRIVPHAFLRLPIELLAGAAVLALLPARIRRATAIVVGVVLALLGLLKLLDAGFKAFLARPFDPLLDWVLLGNAGEFLDGALGETGATVVAVVVVVLGTALLAATAGAVVRLGRLAAEHRRTTLVTTALLGAVWVVMWSVVGGQIVRGVPVAAADAVAQVRDRVVQIPAAIRDQRAFTAEAAVDAFRGVPGDRLLTALRGKDVVFVVVESYGRSAVEDPAMAPRIEEILADGDRRLGAAGFSSRSGFLTSSVAGGGSWLAHATLFSGLWIDNQRRFRDLVASDRLTLTRAFRDAGWETTAVMPGTTRAWPEASFYGHQRVHASDGLGYAGPPFSWSPMPDQFALAAFERLEHGRTDRGPLLAEIALTSSHAPWTPVPRMLPWEQVGDGSVYRSMAGGQTSYESIWTGEPAVIREDYVRSTAYSLQSTLSWIERFGDDRLVVVLLGDHQPAPMVTGPDASHDVPISVITRDPAVLDRVAGWGWTPGLEPPPSAPVWPMDEFRDRFLTTFAR